MSISSTNQELVKVAMMGVGIIALRAAVLILIVGAWIFFM